MFRVSVGTVSIGGYHYFIPPRAEEAVVYKFYDRKTAKLGEKIEDKELYHSGTMIVYADEPRVKFKTKLFSVSLEVPAEDHEKLLQ